MADVNVEKQNGTKKLFYFDDEYKLTQQVVEDLLLPLVYILW